MGLIVTQIGAPIHGREREFFGMVENFNTMLDGLVQNGSIADHKTYYPLTGVTSPWTGDVTVHIEAPTEKLYEVLQDPNFQELLSNARFTCENVQTQVWQGGVGEEAEEGLNRIRTAAQNLGYLTK